MEKSTDQESGDKRERPYRSIRRERLAELVQSEGGATKLARLIDTPKTHISAMLAGARNVGDDLATKIEERLDKPHGWMDAPSAQLDGVSEPPAAYRVARAGDAQGVASEVSSYLNSIDPLLLPSARDMLRRLVDGEIAADEAREGLERLQAMSNQSARRKLTGTG